MSSHGPMSARSSSSEEWRPIPGFETFYEVSNLGRVRSFDVLEEYGYTDRDIFKKGGILKQVITGNNKYAVVLTKYKGKNEGKPVRALCTTTWAVRRLVQRAFPGHLPEGFGLKPSKRLNNAQIRIIKKLLKSGSMKQKEIAEIFSISERTVSDIKRGVKRMDVESEPANMLDCV